MSKILVKSKTVQIEHLDIDDRWTCDFCNKKFRNGSGCEVKLFKVYLIKDVAASDTCFLLHTRCLKRWTKSYMKTLSGLAATISSATQTAHIKMSLPKIKEKLQTLKDNS